MFKYIKAVFLLLPRFIWAYFAWVLRYSINPKKYPLEKRFAKCQAICKKIFAAFDVVCYKDEFVNFYKTKDKNKNYVIISNHMSFIDPLLFLALAETPVTFIAKKEVRKYPFVGRIVRILEGEFLDRQDLKQELKVFMSVQKKLASEERIDILIFPEGTRIKDPKAEVATFHPGTFRCCFKTQAPIMVSPIYGTYRAVNTKYKDRHNAIMIKTIKEVKYEDYKDMNTTELSLYVHDLVNQEVDNYKVLEPKKLKLINKK